MTTHDEIRRSLVAWLSGDLDPKTTAGITEHVEGCDSCRREVESMRSTWNALGEIPEEAPGPEMSERFYDALRAYEDSLAGGGARAAHGTAGRETARGWIGRLGWLLPRHPAVQFALVLAVMIVGGVIGYTLHGNGTRNAEMAQLREEVRSVNRLLIVSLLGQQSAAERLQGVSWTYKVDRSDPEVTGALLQTLGRDPNVNVRLAALDALTRNLDQPSVRDGLVESLGTQTSPMLQMAIVDVVMTSGIEESAGALRRLRDRPGVNDAVKKRIDEALQQFNT